MIFVLTTLGKLAMMDIALANGTSAHLKVRTELQQSVSAVKCPEYVASSFDTVGFKAGHVELAYVELATRRAC